MAEKNNESKPMLSLDGKGYVIDDLTDFQKSIVDDINQYRIQIIRLQRWESGQIMVLRKSLKEEKKKPEPEVSEAEV